VGEDCQEGVGNVAANNLRVLLTLYFQALLPLPVFFEVFGIGNVHTSSACRFIFDKVVF